MFIIRLLFFSGLCFLIILVLLFYIYEIQGTSLHYGISHYNVHGIVGIALGKDATEGENKNYSKHTDLDLKDINLPEENVHLFMNLEWW